jgi:arabinan endo-1,5-alpha-L-arabinosidase
VTETLGSFDAGAFCSIYASKAAEWISGDMWAPDIIYNEQMKKWCMYLSLNGDNWASVIVLLTADSPNGPFKYEAPIVFGGFNNVSYSGKKVDVAKTDMHIVTGSNTLPTRFSSAGNKWGTYYPNCIDPCSFYDEDGELWLAYGSWSGGIFMLKLDKNTGLRDYTYTYTGTTLDANATSDQYFGKKIAGGYYVSGEGPYIQHIGKYYYLFMSYGGYAPDGGYEMRVFRSSSPTGPYKDASGNVATFNNYQLNFGPSATTNKGMKLLGAFNNWGTMMVGECAEGHNSACVDADGNAFVVYHTKFNNSTIHHQVRVRQLFQNEFGWLVASPFRYTGMKTTQAQIESSRLYSNEEIAGTYQLMIHPYKLNHKNYAEATPVSVVLSDDGRISGEKTGTWEFTQEGKSYIKMVISGVTYYGVVAEQNIDGLTDMPAVCISCVSNGGVPVWAFKNASKSAIVNAYNVVKNYLSGTLAEDAPLLEGVDVKYECYEDFDKTIPSNTLSVDGKYTPTADGGSRYVWFTVTAGDYYYSSGVYHPKTTAGYSTRIGNAEVVKAKNVEAAKRYNLQGQLVNESYNGIMIVNGSKILWK